MRHSPARRSAVLASFVCTLLLASPLSAATLSIWGKKEHTLPAFDTSFFVLAKPTSYLRLKIGHLSYVPPPIWRFERRGLRRWHTEMPWIPAEKRLRRPSPIVLLAPHAMSLRRVFSRIDAPYPHHRPAARGAESAAALPPGTPPLPFDLPVSVPPDPAREDQSGAAPGSTSTSSSASAPVPAPVPLPGSGWLLLSALTVAVLHKARRRKPGG